MPSTTLPPSATSARLCVADACAPARAESGALRAELSHRMRDGESVLVRVEALDTSGAIVAIASGTVVGREPDMDCHGADGCVSGFVVVDQGFTGVRREEVLDRGTSDVARYQLLFQRTIPGFEPSAES